MGIFAGVVLFVYALIINLYLRKDEIKLINNKKRFYKRSENNVMIKDIQI